MSEKALRKRLQKRYGKRGYQIRRAKNDRYGYTRDYIVYRAWTENDGGHYFWAFGGYVEDLMQQ